MLPKEFSEAADRASRELYGKDAQPEILLDGRIPTGEQFRVYRGRVNGLGRFLIAGAATSHPGGEIMLEEIFNGSAAQVRHPSRTERGRGPLAIKSFVMGFETSIVFPAEYEEGGKILIDRQEVLPPLEVIEGEGRVDLAPEIPSTPDSGQLRAVQ
jgi:hypothetical protein